MIYTGSKNNPLNSCVIRANQRNGFTLIEIIIYIALVSIILVAATNFTWDILSGQAKSRVFQEVQQNARFAIHIMEQDIRQAKKFSIISPFALSLDDDSIVFEFAGDKLTKTIGAGSPIDLTSDQVEVSGSFTNLSFQNRSKNVKINMTVEYKNPENIQDLKAIQEIETAVELRGE